MDEFDLDEIAAQLDDEHPVQLVEPGTPEADRVPPGWRAIAASDDPAARRAAALALWNPDFLELVPRFARALRENLADVRLAVLRGDPVLLYLVRPARPPYTVWVGWHPDTFGATPPNWAALPAPLRRFLREVHAGFTATDWQSFGPVQPASMMSFAEWAGFDGPIPGWDGSDGRIASDRLFFVAKDGGLLHHCTSPDLEAGKVALVYEGDVEIADFAPALDELMAGRFDS
ncbi:hypothetical protein GCM10017786_45960 [Amycolatopsis deserti]|uniref:Uncharacterized protein n=1 Tax=Amycolatopsis deserti TaxID=185696 RepID=A0ABQ3J6F6_9PSEU|nr:hypothetical protein [Amycolatopsis deserti]GHF07159.1 hypothetical protein GCM10017786_45960 [Amycolatopsis deserti]